MFEPLTIADLAGLPATTRVYCQPACFVERPHGLDGRVARVGDGMVWFAAWQVTVRGPETPKREALVPVETIAQWIAVLPDDLAHQASTQVAAVGLARPSLAIGARTVRLSEPQVMAILNLTPDSFSDGGRFGDPERAAAAGFDMAAAGAAVIDVGGESTRPGAKPLWEGDEVERVVPVIERLARSGIAVSIDTRKAAVMEAALAAGAGLINDVAALAYDDRALAVAAKAQCPVVLMHAPSQKSDPHEGGGAYADAALDVFDWLAARIDAVVAGGVTRDRIVVDPGIGFGKGVEDNLRIINILPLFHALGCPLLLGASRKRFIGAVDGEAEITERLGGSVALTAWGAQSGVQLHRVHDVVPHRQALRVWRAMRDTALVRG